MLNILSAQMLKECGVLPATHHRSSQGVFDRRDLDQRNFITAFILKNRKHAANRNIFTGWRRAVHLRHTYAVVE